MRRRAVVILAAITLTAVPGRAQVVVIDPVNLVQTTLTAYRTQQHYAELVAEYLTVVRMAQALGNMDGYRIPAIPITLHDATRWEYARPYIEALNRGDATG